MQNIGSTEIMFSRPLEHSAKSLKYSTRRRTADGQTPIKKVQIIPYHTQ